MEATAFQEPGDEANPDLEPQAISRLLSLPREIRDMIYNYIVPSSRPSNRVKLMHNPNRLIQGRFWAYLLHVSRMTRAENLALYATVPVDIPWHKFELYLQVLYHLDSSKSGKSRQRDILLNMTNVKTGPVDILPFLRFRLSSSRVETRIYASEAVNHFMQKSILHLADSCMSMSPYEPKNTGSTKASPSGSQTTNNQAKLQQSAFSIRHEIHKVILNLEGSFPRLSIHFKHKSLQDCKNLEACSADLNTWRDYMGLRRYFWFTELEIIIDKD